MRYMKQLLPNRLTAIVHQGDQQSRHARALLGFSGAAHRARLKLLSSLLHICSDDHASFVNRNDFAWAIMLCDVYSRHRHPSMR